MTDRTENRTGEPEGSPRDPPQTRADAQRDACGEAGACAVLLKGRQALVVMLRQWKSSAKITSRCDGQSSVRDVRINGVANMSNQVFDALFREKANLFSAAFSSVSTEVFYDAATNKIRHAGEYGIYREAVVRDFLRFVIPRAYDISTGFIITSLDDVSTQCDIVVYDPRMTPLYQEGDRQRFFPVESVFCVGEVKSTLSKQELGIALNKLAKIKALGERIANPASVGKTNPNFDPKNHPYDLVPSILICQKLGFALDDLSNQIPGFYDATVLHRHKHNMILSLEDGLLSYVDKNGVNLPYPRLANMDLKNRFMRPTPANKYVHFKLFGSYMFMLTANKTPLYPEVSNYLGDLSGGTNIDQN